MKPKYNFNKSARKQKLSFYQLIKNNDKIRYNVCPEKTSMIDQRNSSANKSAFFIDKISKELLQFEIAGEDPDDLKF